MTQPLHHDVLRALHAHQRPTTPTPSGITGHDVQFYRSDAHLVSTACDFLADGLRAGQPLVIIATPPHRRAFAAALRTRGLDPNEPFSNREITWLDARETLDAFMEGDQPNPELFLATVGNVFERVLQKRTYLIARGYGEMVDLLASDGNVDGAIALETLWNDLAASYPYSLLCGYVLDNVVRHAGASGVRRICEQHAAVLPADLPVS